MSGTGHRKVRPQVGACVLAVGVGWALRFPPPAGLQPLETAPAPWRGLHRSSPVMDAGLHLNSGWPYIQYTYDRSTTDVDLQQQDGQIRLRSGLSGADNTCQTLCRRCFYVLLLIHQQFCVNTDLAISSRHVSRVMFEMEITARASSELAEAEDARSKRD
jgi:hypothetical protein